ncbi:hypothetical protein [Brevibacillus sp. MCWH]|uniref:hypothetical protein n=1 Tax=Brevibacillus sp. MCWH TaxID=2508871 RepID=UPI00149221C1|nr:hypothetical protein [Brevibacillus sp. MCWH]NNV04722.1 hypothetical protein [Brevibacillus sp. MCWH]
MLNNLKMKIKQQELSEFVMEAMTKSTDDGVKSIFLDDVETSILGAENDPEVKSLVESIPEYEEHDPETDLGIETMVESLTETDLY